MLCCTVFEVPTILLSTYNGMAHFKIKIAELRVPEKVE
jgi:hypothetical protein